METCKHCQGSGLRVVHVRRPPSQLLTLGFHTQTVLVPCTHVPHNKGR